MIWFVLLSVLLFGASMITLIIVLASRDIVASATGKPTPETARIKTEAAQAAGKIAATATEDAANVAQQSDAELLAGLRASVQSDKPK